MTRAFFYLTYFGVFDSRYEIAYKNNILSTKGFYKEELLYLSLKSYLIL